MQQLSPRFAFSSGRPVWIMSPVRDLPPAYRIPRKGVFLSGLGDATPAQIAGQVGSITGPVVVAAAAPATAAALGISASLAIPIVGAAFAGVLVGIEALLNSGCGQSCIITSQWANQAGELLNQNSRTYFALPKPRTSSQQQSALNMFNAIWNKLVQLCSQPGLSTAGEHCISDRQAGACHWTQVGNPEFPGQPQPGQCFNWWNTYHDPIANDSPIVDDTVSSVASSITSPLSSIAPGSSTVWLFAGAALIGAALLGGN